MEIAVGVRALPQEARRLRQQKCRGVEREFQSEETAPQKPQRERMETVSREKVKTQRTRRARQEARVKEEQR